ncbi:MAG TPA: lysophospholipid acyltransferase family protein [Polyangia bacterium]|nr:lysophospholipid acyltransferase family protein [Polyangia bacterium]
MAETLVLAIVAVLSRLVDRSGETVFKIARFWSRLVLGVPGVRVKFEQRAPLDPKRPYVFMGNHASMIDIWAVFVAVPVSFRFIAKKQLSLIPIFGWAMWAGRFIFIDRQNAAAARRSIDEAARRIKAGQSVVIFPEGTRTRDGRLRSFKKGGFHLAIDSGADIVPMAIHGSRALMPRGAMLIRGGEVRLQLGEPISTAGLGPGDRDRMLKLVHERIAAMLGEPGEPAPAEADVQ